MGVNRSCAPLLCLLALVTAAVGTNKAAAVSQVARSERSTTTRDKPGSQEHLWIANLPHTQGTKELSSTATPSSLTRDPTRSSAQVSGPATGDADAKVVIANQEFQPSAQLDDDSMLDYLNSEADCMDCPLYSTFSEAYFPEADYEHSSGNQSGEQYADLAAIEDEQAHNLHSLDFHEAETAATAAMSSTPALHGPVCLIFQDPLPLGSSIPGLEVNHYAASQDQMSHAGCASFCASLKLQGSSGYRMASITSEEERAYVQANVGQGTACGTVNALWLGTMASSGPDGHGSTWEDGSVSSYQAFCNTEQPRATLTPGATCVASMVAVDPSAAQPVQPRNMASCRGSRSMLSGLKCHLSVQRLGMCRGGSWRMAPCNEAKHCLCKLRRYTV